MNQRGHVNAPTSSRPWQLWPYGSRGNDWKKGIWNLSLLGLTMTGSTEATHISPRIRSSKWKVLDVLKWELLLLLQTIAFKIPAYLGMVSFALKAAVAMHSLASSSCFWLLDSVPLLSEDCCLRQWSLSVYPEINNHLINHNSKLFWDCFVTYVFRIPAK